MKRGRIVARRRFWNKYGKTIVNATLMCAIIIFGITLSTVIRTNMNANKTKVNAAYDTTSNLETIDSINGDIITTSNGNTYTLSNAEEIAFEYDVNNNSKLEVLVVDNKAVTIIVSYN